MKLLIMTDMEGVAGVLNAQDYLAPSGRLYEVGRELTTRECNAAVEGALAAGATEILVVDGHGAGAIDPRLLHPAARLLAGQPKPRAFGCDPSFDAAFVVGQHAMSNTDGGHLAHTNSWGVESWRLNGLLIGELGKEMLLFAACGVPTVLVTGDAACCAEARALVPEVETAAVKEGVRRGSATGLTAEANARFNQAAVHLHPDRARDAIRAAAERALRRRGEIPLFVLPPPYELVSVSRPAEGRPAGEGAEVRRVAGDDLAEVLGSPPRPPPAGAAPPAGRPAGRPADRPLAGVPGTAGSGRERVAR
jgi:D-amino peptidase